VIVQWRHEAPLSSDAPVIHGVSTECYLCGVGTDLKSLSWIDQASYTLSAVFDSESFSWTSFVIGFLPGFLSGYLLQRIQHRREKALDLCERLYRPLHRQLSDGLREIVLYSRANSIDPALWIRLEADGFTEHIKDGLRQELRELFTIIQPSYDRSWIALNNHAIPTLRERWDQQFGIPPGAARIRDVDWQKAAIEEDFEMPSHPLEPAVDAQRPQEVVRLWNWVVTQQRLDAMPGGLEAFLHARKNELRQLPETHDYLENRADIMHRTTMAQLKIKPRLIH